MYADRYAPRRMNRGSLGLSVSIVGGMVAAVMLSPTVINHLPDRGPLETYTVPPPAPPPPPEPPQPKVERKTTQVTHVDATRTIIPIPADDTFHVTPPDPGPPVDLRALEGAGNGAVIDPPKPPPVIVGTQVDPRYARELQPAYPPAEQRAGRDGVVTLKVLVGVDGRVVRAEQVAATSDDFWRATLKQALARWRFKPATRDGAPFEQWRTMTVRFNLEEQP